MKFWRFSTMIVVGLVLLALVPFVLIKACPEAVYESPMDVRVDNVVRIFMHTPNSFTVLIEQTGTKELKLHKFDFAATVTVFADVAPESKMWAMFKRDKGKGYGVLELHVHAPASIEGGGWDKGKDGRGTTHVIE